MSIRCVPSQLRHLAVLFCVTAFLVSCGDSTSPGKAGVAATIQMVSGNNQQGGVQADLASPLAVGVRDASGRPVAGQTVTFAVTQGSGAVSPASAVTNGDGRAQTVYRVGSLAGPQTITATVGSLPPVLFSETGIAGSAASLIIVTGDGQSGTVGTALQTAVSVRSVDAQGNSVAGVSVSFATGTGTFAPTTGTTNSAGELSTSWTLGPVSGPQVAVATATGLAPLTLHANATAGQPTQILIARGDLQSGTAGAVLPNPVVVRVADSGGNGVAGVVVTFGASSGGSASPQTATTDAAGEASTTWTLGTAFGTNVLSASALAVPTVAAHANSAPALWALDHKVIDAEYNTARDVLVTVSANPSRLNIVDPVAKTIRSVSLTRTPTSVSIQPDGRYAAVGHDGLVTLINLTVPAVEHAYTIRSNSCDVVLAGNGYIYVFPRTDQWVGIHAVNISTGVEDSSVTIYAGTTGRLDASGTSIYGATNGLIPSDLQKYDIRSGLPQSLGKSPYWGEHDFKGLVWVSDDGTRLFSRGADVFTSSSVHAQDMIYTAHLAGMTTAQWVTGSAAAGRIFAMPSSAASEFRVYDGSSLSLRGTVPLPSFAVTASDGSTKFYAAVPQYVFVDATGKKIFTVVSAATGSGLSLDWAIATYTGPVIP